VEGGSVGEGQLCEQINTQVQRLTVYRHFPDDTALFAACTSHWFQRNPPPDASSWGDEEGYSRVLMALHLLYSYYRKTERMWSLSYRDEADVPALHEPMKQVRIYLENVRDDLTKHINTKRSTTERVRITLGHAVQFSTWQSLASHQQNDTEIANLVCTWLDGTLNGTTIPNPHAKKV